MNKFKVGDLVNLNGSSRFTIGEVNYDMFGYWYKLSFNGAYWGMAREESLALHEEEKKEIDSKFEPGDWVKTRSYDAKLRIDSVYTNESILPHYQYALYRENGKFYGWCYGFELTKLEETKVEQFKKGDRVLFLDKIEGTVVEVSALAGFRNLIDIKFDGVEERFNIVEIKHIKKIEPSFKVGQKVWVKAVIEEGLDSEGDYGLNVSYYVNRAQIKARGDDE